MLEKFQFERDGAACEAEICCVRFNHGGTADVRANDRICTGDSVAVEVHCGWCPSFGSGRRPDQSAQAQSIAVRVPRAPATRPISRGLVYCDAIPAAAMETIMT